MFDYIFATFNDICKVYEKNTYNFSKSTILCLIVTVLLTGFYLFSLFWKCICLKILSTLVLIVGVFVIGAFSNAQRKSNRNWLIETYKEKRLDIIKTELDDSEKYDLYNKEGLNWLIACCDARLKDNQSRQTYIRPMLSIQGSLFPLVTIITTIDNTLKLRNDLLSVFFLAVAVFVPCYYVYLRNMLHKLDVEKSKFDSFKEDLEYIKLKYPAKKTDPINNHNLHIVISKKS